MVVKKKKRIKINSKRFTRFIFLLKCRFIYSQEKRVGQELTLVTLSSIIFWTETLHSATDQLGKSVNPGLAEQATEDTAWPIRTSGSFTLLANTPPRPRALWLAERNATQKPC